MTRMLTNADYLRTLRLLAIEKNLCGQCRARPARPGLKSCQKCADRRTDLQASLRKRRLCHCGRKRKRGFKQCSACILSKAVERDRRKLIPAPLTTTQQTVLARLASFADDRYRFPREMFEMPRGTKVPGAARALVNRGFVERLSLPPKGCRDPYAYRVTAAGRAHIAQLEHLA